MTCRIVRAGIGFVLVAAVGLAAGDGRADEGLHLYLSAHGGVSFGEGDSGGFNTLGPHPNTGDDNHDSAFGGGALGVAVPVGPVVLRFEAEGTGERSYDMTTESFAPPSPTFFYDAEVRSWTAMGNLWLDVPLPARFLLSVGGGAGASFHDLEVDDTVVAGSSNSDTAFSWQVGAGLGYAVNDWLTLEIGYRYRDMGEVEAQLRPIGGGARVGDYELDLVAHEAIGGLRIRLPGL